MPRYHKIHTDEESDDEDDDDEVFVRVANDLPTILQNTIGAIKEGKRILYQPTFQVGDCLVRADFMVKNGDGYDLVEVKAKSGVRKDVTDDGEKKKIGSIDAKFINDLSFQSHVINKSLAEN
jgi:hypothetical protein